MNPTPRAILSAEILAIGSELTTGALRDTNGGELAALLSRHGILVRRISALPDDLAIVTDAFTEALEHADVVISTGGLGPTPDDLTREAIAATCGSEPEVDPVLEHELRQIFSRRDLSFPETNRKQAWLIPSATAIPNPNGTAPGWWVDRPDGRLIIALPGPPREMRPMFNDWVVPRLAERGAGADRVSHTYRLHGIGESHLCELIGEEVLRRTNPIVATYARADGLDVRVSAFAEGDHSAEQLVREIETWLIPLLQPYVWGHDDDTWPDALGREMTRTGWTLAIDEAGTRGTLSALLGDMPWVIRTESHALPSRHHGDHGTDAGAAGAAAAAGGAASETREPAEELLPVADAIRSETGADVGIAIEATPRGADMTVAIAVATPETTITTERLIFLNGTLGRQRAAVAAASVLEQALRYGALSMSPHPSAAVDGAHVER